MFPKRIQSFKNRLKSLSPSHKRALVIFCGGATIFFLLIKMSIPFRLVIAISSDPWERVDEGTLYDYEFVNSTHGWRSKVDDQHGFLQMTTDGGLTWQTQLDPEYPFRTIKFANATVGAAVRGSEIVVTNNGGVNWTVLQLTYIHEQGQQVNASIDDLSICADGIAWVVGGQNLFRIDIPNLNWTYVSLLHCCASSIHMFNSTYGWITAFSKGIYHTRNGWQNYTTQTEGVRPVSYTGIFFWDAYRGWAVGWDETIIATSDGGAHWVLQHEVLTIFSMIIILNGVYFHTESQGWAYGTANTYYTENGGQNWVPIPVGSDIESMCFANATHGWAIAGKNSLKTTVGGRYGLSEGLANIFTGVYSCGLAIVLLHYMNQRAIRRTISRNKKCRACNALILSHTAFCGNCGTPYESQRLPDKGHPEN